MRNIWLSVVVVVTCSRFGWAIYGPSLTRADNGVAMRACQEASFVRGAEIVNAMRGGHAAEIERILGNALKEWKATPETSAFYAARAFCRHELVPDRLPAGSQDLATEWGRHAFLMMTLMGWSEGACQEGPDQFREVIKHRDRKYRIASAWSWPTPTRPGGMCHKWSRTSIPIRQTTKRARHRRNDGRSNSTRSTSRRRRLPEWRFESG